MANWNVLKAAVANIINANGKQEITGQLLQNVLNNIITNVGENATFAGIATLDTNPGAPDGPVFYLATTAGVYPNFNGLEVLDGEAIIFLWNNSAWTKKVTGFATQEKLQELEENTNEKLSQLEENTNEKLSQLEENTNEKLSQLGSELRKEICNKIDISKCNVTNGYVKLDGTFYTDSRYRLYKLSVDAYESFFAILDTEKDSLAISFYDINNNYIESGSKKGENNANERKYRYYVTNIPENASYIGFTTYAGENVEIYGKEKDSNLIDVLINNSIVYKKTEDADNIINEYIRYDSHAHVPTGGAKTYYYLNDNYDYVVVKTYSVTNNILCIGFLDQFSNFITEYSVKAKYGQNTYVVKVPKEAFNIVACNPELDENFQVYLYKNTQRDVNDAINNTVKKVNITKDRHTYDRILGGYIRHNSDGEIVVTGGSRTLVYKNQGYDYIDVYATYDGTEDVLASFNSISFYSVDNWLGGVGYMKDESVQAIYGRRKGYRVKVPSGCGLILVTLDAKSGVITDLTATIEMGRGTKGDYLEVLKHTTDERFVLPPYYTESYLRNKVNVINNRIKANASNSDIFIWMTDEHFEVGAGNSYGIIRKLSNELNIPRLFSGGDMSNEGVILDAIKLRNKAFDGKIYQVIGNHEYLSYNFEESGSTTEDEIFYAFEQNYGNEVKFGNNARHYYYVDNEVQKIRYIILNSYKEGDGSVNSAAVGYESEQLEWFENIALNVDSGWSIIIFTHRLYEGSVSQGATLYIPDACVPVVNIITSYVGKGKIIGIFQGHTHFDRIMSLKNGTIPVIVTTSDNNGLYRYDESLEEYVRDYDVKRESGTINEHAFDVVIVDKTLKRISLVRMGCPARDGSEPNGELVEERFAYWV